MMKPTTRAKRILHIVVAVAALNFTAFCVVGLSIGGDALNGRAAEGRYYLAHGGEETEVSRAIWVYSFIHAVSVFVTHGAVFVTFLYLYRKGELKLRGQDGF